LKTVDLIATLGWTLLALGWWFRGRRAWHLGFVIPGMAADLGLVVYLEMTRSVIELTAEKSYSLVQWTHIGTSTAATVLYIPTIILGARLIARSGGPAVRAWHKRCAVSALALRTVGFAFMWAV
jgi:hypothetical protein